MNILLLSDIHGNYPALEAIDHAFAGTNFDQVINCGDSTVYAPFPNEVLDWLARRRAISILGNTDKKVLKLLQGKDFKKPSNPEKRVMYELTADQLTAENRSYLGSFPIKHELELTLGKPRTGAVFLTIGVHHGSPARPHELLFADTADSRFEELAAEVDSQVIVTGHSHSPYHKVIDGVHFINPGSAGRMFDGDPSVSCATLEIQASSQDHTPEPASTVPPGREINLYVRHYRIHYDISLTIKEIQRLKLPAIYEKMYRLGRKLN